MNRLSEISIKDNVGKIIDVAFILKEAKVRPQKDGKECMNLVIRDKDCEEEAKIFAIEESMKTTIVAGKVYTANLKVQEYARGKNGLSLIVEGKPTLREDIDPTIFSDWVENYESYVEKFQTLMQFIYNSDYGKIAYEIINSRWNKFVQWSAAKSMHHTSLGGLLMHSVTVAENCKAISELYNGIYGGDFINLKLVVASALLHDVMKTEEFSCDTTSGLTEYTRNSIISSHIVDIGYEVRRIGHEIGGLDPFKIEELVHCLLAHHGRKEWGSPVEPHCMEAVILNQADNIDADAWKCHKAIKDLGVHEHSVRWASDGTMIAWFKSSNDTDIKL